MAGPYTINPGGAASSTTVWGEACVHIGPFIDGNGNLYCVFEYQDLSPQPEVYKSTDGGATWAAMDHANAPAWSSWGDLEGPQVVQGDQTLWIANHRNASSVGVEHWAYRTSDHPTNPDTWNTAIREVVRNTSTTVDQCLSLERRSNGDEVVFYHDSGATDQIAYQVKPSGGSWSAVSNISVASKKLTQAVCVRGASNLIHVFIKDSTDGSIRYYTFSTGNTPSSVATIATGLSTSAAHDYAILARPVYINDSGTEKIYVAWVDSTGVLKGTMIVNGTPSGTIETISSTVVSVNPETTTSLSPVAFICAEGLKIHCLYADNATTDLWHTVRSAAGVWATPDEIIDGITCQYVNAAVYTRAGSTKLGILYSDDTAALTNGVAKFVDVSLTATAPDPQTFTITNTGGGTLNWSATKTQAWLTLSPTSGTLAAGASATVTASVAPGSLTAGTYNDTITVSDSGASNSPQTVAVTFNVTGGAVTLTGIASAEAFGSATVQPGAVSASPASIPTAEALGTTAVTAGPVSVTTQSIATAEAIGSLSLTRGAVVSTLTGIPTAETFGTTSVSPGASSAVLTGIPTAEVLGTASVTRGAVTTTLTGIATGEVVGTASVTVGAVSVTLSGITTGEALGGTVVQQGGVPTVTFSGIASSESLGTLSVQAGPVSAGTTSIPSAEAFGTFSVQVGAASVVLTGIATAETLGTTSVTRGPVNVSAVSIASSEGIGALAVQTGAVAVSVSGIAGAEVLPAPALQVGATSVTLSGISSAESVGNTVVQAGATLVLSGISSAEVLGSAALTVGSVSVSTSGVSSAEAVGTPIVTTAALPVAPQSIASAEAFGSSSVTRGPVSTSLSGVPSAEAFGVASVQPGAVQAAFTGIPSAQAFGSTVVLSGAASVTFAGIGSSEGFGLVVLSAGAVSLSAVAIPTAEAFGTLVLGVSFRPLSISSSEAFGALVVSAGAAGIVFVSVPSAEGFGTALLLSGAISASLFGIDTEESFGHPSIAIQGNEAPTGGWIARGRAGDLLRSVRVGSISRGKTGKVQ